MTADALAPPSFSYKADGYCHIDADASTAPQTPAVSNLGAWRWPPLDFTKALARYRFDIYDGHFTLK